MIKIVFVLKHSKYCQIDPRDKIVLWIELEDDCDKLAIDPRRQVLSTQLTDNGPVYYVMQTKLITILDDDMPWRNFLSPEFGTKFHRKVPLFLEIL